MATTKTFKFRGEQERLDKCLALHFPNLSRAEIQRLIKRGKVAVNGVAVTKPSLRLSAGDEVTAEYAPSALPEVSDWQPPIVYEDDDIIVVNKPPGLLVHPTATQPRMSLAGALVARCQKLKTVGEDRFRPGIVHRLDVNTSGLLVVAKKQAVYEHLKRMFQERAVVKKYLALVHGKLEKLHGMIDLPVGRRTGHKKFEAGVGREAQTEYWVRAYYQFRPACLKNLAGKAALDIYTLVDVQLHTGRTHQIRVHFSYLGHPVAGDKLYGGRFKKIDQQIFPRQFLHAYYLKFKLPNGNLKEFQIDLADDLKKVMKHLKIQT